MSVSSTHLVPLCNFSHIIMFYMDDRNNFNNISEKDNMCLICMNNNKSYKDTAATVQHSAALVVLCVCGVY